jgi:hypothetical protein
MPASSQCLQCGTVVGVSDTFCGECGAQISLSTSSQSPESAVASCPTCGCSAPADSAFCSECGQAFVAAGPTSALGQAMDYSSVNFCLRLLVTGEQEIQSAYDDPEGGMSISLLKSGRYELGLILTDLSKLREQFGANYPTFERTLNEYIAYKISDRCAYLMLDVSDNLIAKMQSPSWQQIVGLINNANGFLKEHLSRTPDTIFILGDNDVIPMGRFPNHIITDPDREVETDLIYSTLSDSDPWQQAGTALVPQLKVGRLPFGMGFGPDKFSHYLANIREKVSRPPEVSKVSGISAKVWEMASQSMYSRLGGGLVKTSPELGLENVLVEINVNAAIQFFNLHGTDTDAYWYGEENFQYPRTFGPETASQMRGINAIAVEACYGAKFIGCNESDSILLRALSHRTLGFLGSSKIAFGPAIPPNSLADVMAGEFLLAVQNGKDFGSATNIARKATLNMSLLDGMTIKTLLSFNLFGDPTEKLLSTGLSLGQIEFDELQVEIPDVLQEIRQSSMEANPELSEQVRSQLKVGIPEMDEVQPKITRIYLAGLKKEVNGLYYQSPSYPSRMAIVYADDSGKVMGEFLSK